MNNIKLLNVLIGIMIIIAFPTVLCMFAFMCVYLAYWRLKRQPVIIGMRGTFGKDGKFN